MFEFPATRDCTKIKITVSMEGETTPPPYWLTILRPKKVKARSDIFTIVGGQDNDTAPAGFTVRYFDHGEPVVVRAAPPFGNLMSTVTRAEMDDSGDAVPATEVALSSETDLYGFTMPDTNVIIEGSYDPVTQDTNVLYVRGLSDEEIALLEANPTAIPSGDASSWANASLDLQDVMDNKWSAGKAIWISSGKVRPDWSTVSPGSGWASALTAAQIAAKRNWSFILKNGVQIYGGFNGTETEKTGRNPALYETILSGDLGEAGRVKHVVIAAGISNGTRLDGLTISGGNCLIDGYDPGFRINGKVLTPSTEIYGGGGGLINIDAGPWLHNVIFRENTAMYGGAVFNWNSSPVLTNVTISNCVAPSYCADVYSNSGSNLLMIGGRISGNQGDAVFVQVASSILINLTISGNTGYGVDYNAISANSQRLINLTIEGNDSGWINNIDVSKVVYNSVIKGNSGFYATGDPVNSSVNGSVANPGDAVDYWPLVNNVGTVLNTNSPYNGGGDLYGVYTRLNGLPQSIKDEIFPLLQNLPEKGAKE
jgi:hypothetical protein